MLAKDGSSGDDGCPSVYLAEDGGLVVQGDMLDADTYGNLKNLLPGEGAVRISPAVVAEAMRLYTSRG
jgi:hypothetical protein